MKVFNLFKNLIQRIKKAIAHADANLQTAKDYADERGDYIVEEGTANSWQYRKWASGIAECWQSGSLGSIAITSSYANGMYYYASAKWYYPTNLFIASPIVNATAQRATGLFFISLNYVDKNYMQFYFASSQKESTTQNTLYHFTARGFWKTFTPFVGG